MRGAVSVALVYAYYDPHGNTTDRPRSTLISMTLTVVLVSTLAFGAVTKPLLDYLLGTQGTLLYIPAPPLLLFILIGLVCNLAL